MKVLQLVVLLALGLALAESLAVGNKLTAGVKHDSDSSDSSDDDDHHHGGGGDHGDSGDHGDDGDHEEGGDHGGSGGKCKHGDYAPNPVSCGSFLQCVWGKWYTMPCPSGLHWNDRIQVCDWPKEAGCDRAVGKQLNVVEVDAKHSSESSDSDEHHHGGDGDHGDGGDHGGSGGKCKHGNYAPNPKDCGSFLQCVWGKWYTMPCPSGLHWNKRIQVCDWPKDAHCK